jgi:hypothetical protein
VKLPDRLDARTSSDPPQDLVKLQFCETRIRFIAVLGRLRKRDRHFFHRNPNLFLTILEADISGNLRSWLRLFMAKATKLFA